MGIVSSNCGGCVPIERGRRSAMRTWIWRLTMAVVAAVMVYAVYHTAAVRQNVLRAEAYRLELTEQIARLREENERLEREIAQADDEAVIEKIARTRLGLVRSGEIIFYDAEPSVSGERE